MIGWGTLELRLREAVLEEIFILSLSSGRSGLSLEALLCSGVPQAVVSTNDWIFLYIYRKPIGLMI